MKYWFKLAQEKSVVRRTDHPDMTMAIDLNIEQKKQKTNQNISPIKHRRLERSSLADHVNSLVQMYTKIQMVVNCQQHTCTSPGKVLYIIIYIYNVFY